MISPLRLLGKWHSGPAVTEIVANCTLMVLPKAFLLCLVGPHDPAVQGLIKLARPHQPLTDPVIETRAWDFQHPDQFCWPPFIRPQSVALSHTRAWRSQSQLSLQSPDRLRPKAGGGAGRAIASIVQCLDPAFRSAGRYSARSACQLVESRRPRGVLHRSTRCAPGHAHLCPAHPLRPVRRPGG